MKYNIGDIVEVDSGEKYFVHDYVDYANMSFAFLINIENTDDFDIYESITKGKDTIFKRVRDKILKKELYVIFYNR
jgi:hypothetical protein